jgi:hypothetical protein
MFEALLLAVGVALGKGDKGARSLSAYEFARVMLTVFGALGAAGLTLAVMFPAEGLDFGGMHIAKWALIAFFGAMMVVPTIGHVVMVFKRPTRGG